MPHAVCPLDDESGLLPLCSTAAGPGRGRHVNECRTSHPQQASVLLAMFRQLYDIEDRAKELSSENRLALRQAESVPVLNQMQTYLDSDAVSVPRVLPKSDFAQAVNYLNNHWQQLQLYTTNGSIPIDNNDVVFSDNCFSRLATIRSTGLRGCSLSI